jgi:hypothetical protein
VKPKFKQGDWVVFTNYNNYPVRLEDEPVLGVNIYNLSSPIFSSAEALGEEILNIGLDRRGAVCYHYVEPRHKPMPRYASWVEEANLRKATKRDFNRLMKNARSMASNASEEIWRVKKARKEAGV